MGHPGMRGIVADRNGKILLLVNGRRMNQDAHDGAVSELENNDLGDIERIEVIRGPGSVTYGPGAIMGLVNIVTKHAQDAPGLQAKSYGNLQYRQNGVALSFGGFLGDVELFSYLSVTRTLGQENTRFFAAYDSVVGYVGEDLYQERLRLKDTLPDGSVKPAGTGEASNFLGDYWNTPQVKAHVDLGFLDEFRVLARYANSDNVQLLTVGNGSKTWIPSENRYANSSAIRIRQVSLSLENAHDFTPEISLKTSMEWNNQDFRRMIIRNPDRLFSLENYSHNFSEQRTVFTTLGRWTPLPDYKFALGAEYSATHVGNPWFQDSAMLRLGDAQNMFGDTSTGNSAIYRGEGKTPVGYVSPANAIFVGDGWDAGMGSVFGEANPEFHPWLNLLFSALCMDQPME